jgi:hypothetical protein
MQPKYKRTLSLVPVVALVAATGAAAMPVLAQRSSHARTETHRAQAVSTLDNNATELEAARQAELAAETSRNASRIALADKVAEARAAKAASAARAYVISRAWAREKIRLKGAKAAALSLHQRQAKAKTLRVKLQRAQAAARLVQRRKAQAAAARRASAQRASAQRASAKRAAARRAAARRKSTPARSGSPKAYAQSLVGSGAQYRCLVLLWERESGWNYRAANPSSGAYGIPQSLPGSKMASAGSDWRTNPQTQIRWGIGYIKNRYGTPCSAWAHSENVGWY